MKKQEAYKKAYANDPDKFKKSSNNNYENRILKVIMLSTEKKYVV